MLKKIDNLLIKGFFPPFVVTFGIAIFVLITQAMWRYIDQIIGKGAGVLFILELLFYLSISLIPMALPIGILISSVMLMGNLAERFELTSLKSAGIPLLRVMRPLIIICTCIGVFSWVCANYLIPVSTLKFRTRLSDIKNQKPALSLEEGSFNEDFEDFVIYIGGKDQDNRFIQDVIVYERLKNTKGKISQIHAREGEMYTRNNDRFFIMNLKDGVKYEELNQSGKRNKSQQEQAYPFIRTYFGEWSYTFDLSEFQLTASSEDDKRKHYRMMSSAQLRGEIDTLAREIKKKQERLTDYTATFFHLLRRVNQDSSFLDTLMQTELDQPPDSNQTLALDSIRPPPDSAQIADSEDSTDAGKTMHEKLAMDPQLYKKKIEAESRHLSQRLDKPFHTYASFLETFESKDHEKLFNRAKSAARSIKGNAESIANQLQYSHEKYVKTVFELHSKISMAVVCVIFLFIGAPMGAIVRKGGFGYPILVAIIFFTLYIILSITFKNMAEEHIMTGSLAAWLPCMILFPIGLVLTYQAMNDRKLVDISRIINWFRTLIDKLRKQNTAQEKL